MMNFIPEFKKTFDVDTQNAEKALKKFKVVMLEANARILTESENRIRLEIGAGKLAWALNIMPDNLVIDVSIYQSQLHVQVVSAGERKGYLFVLFFFTLFALFFAISERSIGVFMVPIVAYLSMQFMSFIPTHPAHRKIGDLFLYIDE